MGGGGLLRQLQESIFIKNYGILQAIFNQELWNMTSQ